MKAALPPLGLLALLLLFPPPLVAETPVDVAKGKLASAEAERKTIEKEMQDTYLAIEADFDLVHSETWKTLRGAFVRAIGAADAKRRAADGSSWSEDLADAFRKVGGITTIVADRLSAAAAAELEGAGPEAADAGGVLAAALKRVFPKEPFSDTWDQQFQDLPVVERWREANDAVARAQEELKAAAAAAAAAAPATPEDGADTPPGMVLVPKGRFVYGPATGLVFDLEKGATEKESRERVSAFYIDVYEVTNSQYLAFLEKRGGKKLPEGYLPTGFEVSKEGTVSMPEGVANRPVRGVSFAAAEEYAESVGKRLPTEEEWEKAARGEDGLLYPWGPEWDPEATNWSGRGLDRPTDVGASPKDRSPYGVMDMAGNVSELTSTFSDRRPRRGKLGPADTITYRGGNYSRDASSCVNTWRWTILATGDGNEEVGFRCVMSERDWK